jgi:hypothetical protein
MAFAGDRLIRFDRREQDKKDDGDSNEFGNRARE